MLPLRKDDILGHIRVKSADELVAQVVRRDDAINDQFRSEPVDIDVAPVFLAFLFDKCQSKPPL